MGALGILGFSSVGAFTRTVFTRGGVACDLESECGFRLYCEDCGRAQPEGVGGCVMRPSPTALTASFAVLLLLGGCGAAPSSTPSTGATTHRHFAVGAAVKTGDAPSGLVADGSSVIVVNNYAKSVVRVDADGTVTPVAEGPDGPKHPALAFGSMWVVLPNGGGTATSADGATYMLNAIGRLDPATGKTQASIAVSGSLLLATETDVWVAGEYGEQYGWVWRIDPKTNHVTTYPGAVGERVAALAYGDGRVWAVTNCQPCTARSVRLVAIDPSSGVSTKMQTDLPLDLQVTDAVRAEGKLWVVGIANIGDHSQGLVVTLDPSGRTTRSVTLGRSVTGSVNTSDGLWVSDCFAGSATLLDPTSGAVRAGPLSVGTPFPAGEPLDLEREDFSCPGVLAAVGNTVWVANWNDDAIVPIRPTD